MENPKLRVKEICKERGWTMKQLAEKIGIAPETLTRSVSDGANPTLATLRHIANAFEIEIGDLFVSSITTNHICGYIEVDGEVYSIRNFIDLEMLYNNLKK
ncbi:MAG: helix-turn-helix transcriptional regulator [Bacteroidales bacterium]|nr:helix-turn-helix transcriptional regulator [Bacteroidales bacterium]